MVDTANSIFKAMLVTVEVASKGTPRAIKNPERCPLSWIPEVVALHTQSATHVLHHAGMHGGKRMKSQKPRGTLRMNRPATDSTGTSSGKILHLMQEAEYPELFCIQAAPRVSKGQHGPCAKTSKTCTRSVSRWAR